MNRIRCVPLMTFREVAPARMAEKVLDRECKRSLSALLEDKIILTRILSLAYSTLNTAMSNAEEPVPLEAAVIRRQFEAPPDRDLIDSVLLILSPNRLRSVLAEARDRIRDRDRLSRQELTLALLPFTSSCIPKAELARECWCGSWILDREKCCAFCGDPPSPKGCTRVWIRGIDAEDQLDSLLELRVANLREQGIIIPVGQDPNVLIDQLEAGALLEEEV